MENGTRTGAARDDLTAVIDAVHLGTLLRAARTRAGLQLYGCDLRAALPPRDALAIEHDRMLAGGMTSHFDPADHTTMLPAYERLVRTLRDVGPDHELDVRRPDLQVVGTYWAQCMMEQVHERVMSRLPSSP